MIFRKVLFVLIAFSALGSAWAQLNNNCPGCAINTAHFGTPAPGDVGLFPDTFVIRQNDSVDIDVTYEMPTQLVVSGVTATVTQVQILGINGSAPLPIGLSVTCDQNTNGCNYYPQTYRFGCVKVCGITSQAATNGYVAAQITVEGTGSALGQTQSQSENITVYYMILPDTTACHTVCFQNKVNTGCDSATLGVYAGIDISCPDPVLAPCDFNWTYGNGNTGSSLATQSETYSTPGTYPVTLEKVDHKLQITAASFSVPPGSALCLFTGGCPWYSNICNGYCVNGSANDFSLNISVGSSNYSTSGAGGGNTSNTWTGLNYDVTNQAVAISVSDACLLSTLNSSTATLTVTGPGTYNWAAGSDATGSITVSLVTVDSVYYTDSVYIYATPDTPVIMASADSLCQGDSARLSIGPGYAGYTINWYQDSTYLTGLTDSFAYMQVSGNYWVQVINPSTHCSVQSAQVPLAVSSQVPTTGGILYYDPTHQLYVNPFIPGNVVVWYYDSTLIQGQSTQFLPYLGDGNYSAVVYPPGFPQCSLTTANFYLNTSGIMEVQDDIYNLSVFPNPNSGTFTVKVNVVTPGAVTLRLTDMLGREVYTNTLTNHTGEVKDKIDVSSLAKNVYTLEVVSANGKATSRVVID